MAGGMDLGTAKGGRKALDAQINLVPFIDLMAVTISFLIMTAVWTQIGRLKVSQSDGAPAADPQTETLVPVTLLISSRELRLTIGSSSYDPVPNLRDPKGRLQLETLKTKLKDFRSMFPDQRHITLQTDDEVRYDDLVHIIDVVVGEGMDALQVTPSMG